MLIGEITVRSPPLLKPHQDLEIWKRNPALLLTLLQTIEG